MEDIKRFIVVDDDATNNLICKFTLQRLFPGIEVEVFQMPHLAINSIKNFYEKTEAMLPTVLFLDVNMPGLSGWDFLEIFATFDKHIHEQITIYMLSSSVDHRDIEQADSNPFVSGYVSKPLSKEWVMGNLLVHTKP